MNVIGLVPARGSSKRIPRKNLAPCAGKPLLAWTAEAALDSRRLDRTILSTDDAEIAEVGQRLGLDVPFLRPAEFSEDAAPMIPVMQHLLDWFASTGETVTALVLLQPTSPLRTARNIDEALEVFFDSGAETVVSVVPLAHIFSPASAHRITERGLEPYFPEVTPPQPPPPAYARNGPAVLINRPQVIQRGEKFGNPMMPYIMTPHDSVDIDEPLDLEWATFLLERRGERGAA